MSISNEIFSSFQIPCPPSPREITPTPTPTRIKSSVQANSFLKFLIPPSWCGGDACHVSTVSKVIYLRFIKMS